MPAAPFLDLDTLDLTKTFADRDAIYSRLPQREPLMMLDRIIHVDMESGVAAAIREVREDEFWTKGHIPGRPLLPGVLMIESAAQFAAYMTYEVRPEETRFMGFGGVDKVKFRGTVVPPAQMLLVIKLVEVRSRRTIADVQGFVDGTMVFEAQITGMIV